ncbi:MAG: hypothetical protein HY299_02400 [Verrucomicrobia bacterium]|nr:hypothetical protein [Verrucomicrobiota bacterium]
MKRSTTIRLVLSGALAGSALTGCGPEETTTTASTQAVSQDVDAITTSESYTNNHHVQGVGYYHAPYHSWWPHPYNYYLPGRGYYHGGNWSDQPHSSGLTSSQPTSSAARQAQTARSATSSSGHSSAISRGGFGGSSHSGGG